MAESIIPVYYGTEDEQQLEAKPLEGMSIVPRLGDHIMIDTMYFEVVRVSWMKNVDQHGDTYFPLLVLRKQTSASGQ
jgi:hypothetical protein